MDRLSDPSLQRGAGSADRADPAARRRPARRRRGRPRPGYGGDRERRIRCAGVAGPRPADHARPSDRGDGNVLMTSLNILSGGAAQGLVASLAAKFKELTGFEIAGEFGAVGAMADKLRKGAPADIVILTSKMILDLANENLVIVDSISNLSRAEPALAFHPADSVFTLKTPT